LDKNNYQKFDIITMKNNNLIIKISLLLCLAITSCNVLDQDNPNDVEQTTVFETAEGLRSARVGMYAAMQTKAYYGGYYLMASDSYSDNGATGGYFVPSLDELGTKGLTATNVIVEDIYVAVYNTINSANHILANVDNSKLSIDASERKVIKGEALFVRALGHFDALKMWGAHWDQVSEYGVPVVTKPQSFSDVLGRSTVTKTYDAIIADLLAADAALQGVDNGKGYVSSAAVKGLLARVYLYAGNKTKAADFASAVIDSKKYSLFAKADFVNLYAGRQTDESIFELVFDPQNRSSYNYFTYSRAEALRTELTFMVSKDLGDFFKTRKDDIRASTTDYVNLGAKSGIAPDGRSEKYRGEQTKDNPAYVLRYAEILLIRAEAKGAAGLADLNTLRTARGMTALKASDVATPSAYADAVQDERRSELNMEGHRYFDLARLQKVSSVLGKDVLPVFPIPYRELAATNNAIKQYPGY
jgi:starch-binding outer membrane protein, SusD/RagB family